MNESDKQRLAEIEKRADALVSDDWYIDYDYRDNGANQIMDHRGLTVCFMPSNGDDEIDEFIANAPQDIPWLIARLGDAEAENTELKAQLRAQGDEWTRMREALREIEHGPGGYWKDPEHEQKVWEYMMEIARKALTGEE